MLIKIGHSIVLLVMVLQFFICGCKSRAQSRLKSDGDMDSSFEFAQEIIPFNRLPLTAIDRDRKIFLDRDWPLPERTQGIQTRKGEPFGLRIIDQSELQKYILPGDIALDYTPIVDPRDIVFDHKVGQKYVKSEGQGTGQEKTDLNHMILVGLGENGMSHAKLVVESHGRLCHVDAPDVMSDCSWEGFLHFFRVDVDHTVKTRVAQLAKIMMDRPSSYQYDAFLYTDVYVKGVSKVASQISSFEAQTTKSLPPLYCSELPFTLYSVAMGKNLFETNFNLIDFAQQIAALKSEPKFAPFVSKEIMQQSFSAFIQQASTVPESVRPMLTTGVKQMLADGYIGTGMRYLVRNYYPPLVLPKHFMLAAQSPEKLPGTRIVYIGSIEQPGPKRTRGYYSSMIYSIGQASVGNYMTRVQEWWNGSPPPSGTGGSLQLNSETPEEAPTYLEPQYPK